MRKGQPRADAIYFASSHPGPRWPRVFVGADGTFAVRWGHKADAEYYGSYVVSLRGTFERKTVSGRVQASGTLPVSGRCRANRTFTARLTRG